MDVACREDLYFICSLRLYLLVCSSSELSARDAQSPMEDGVVSTV